MTGPNYLASGTPADVAIFDLLRDGMRQADVAAIARAVLFRRVRSVLIRAQDKGLIATTLNISTTRSAPRTKPSASCLPLRWTKILDLALHIIKTKKGKFDPRKFDDRYEAAIEELVKAKMEGQTDQAAERARANASERSHGSTAAKCRTEKRGIEPRGTQDHVRDQLR